MLSQFTDIAELHDLVLRYFDCFTHTNRICITLGRAQDHTGAFIITRKQKDQLTQKLVNFVNQNTDWRLYHIREW